MRGPGGAETTASATRQVPRAMGRLEVGLYAITES
jgi:hypothetical protein